MWVTKTLVSIIEVVRCKTPALVDYLKYLDDWLKSNLENWCTLVFFSPLCFLNSYWLRSQPAHVWETIKNVYKSYCIWNIHIWNKSQVCAVIVYITVLFTAWYQLQFSARRWNKLPFYRVYPISLQINTGLSRCTVNENLFYVPCNSSLRIKRIGSPCAWEHAVN